MDKIQFQCSGCGKGLSAPADRAGKNGNCPSCGTLITIPAPAPSTEQTRGTDNEIRFACSSCGKVVIAPPDKAGKTAKCPACSVALQIPQSRDYYKRNLVAASETLLKVFELQDSAEDQQVATWLETAEKSVREVLVSPCLPWLPPGFEVTALSVLGQRYELGGRLAEAQVTLEKALALGRSKGYTGQERIVADTLGDIYGDAALRAAESQQFHEAAAIALKLNELIRSHRETKSFQFAKHVSTLLMVASEALGKMMDSQRQGEAGQNSKGFTLADQCIQAVQQLPDLSPNIAATVHGLLGFRYRLDDRDDEAQEMLETALALGECSGFVLNQEGLYAELLAGLYDVAALSQVQTEQFDEAATTVSKLSALVERFQRHQEFHLLKHRSALLLCKGDILWLRGEFDAALRLYRELIEPPLVEYLASEPSLRWVLGTSHAQIGLVNLRGGHLQEAILFLQEALSYFDPTDKRFRRAETLLNEAKSQEAAAY